MGMLGMGMGFPAFGAMQGLGMAGMGMGGNPFGGGGVAGPLPGTGVWGAAQNFLNQYAPAARPPMNLANAFAARNAQQRAGLGGSMGYDTYNMIPMGAPRIGGMGGGGGGGYGGGGGGYSYGGAGAPNGLLQAMMQAQAQARNANIGLAQSVLGDYNRIIGQTGQMLDKFSTQGSTDIDNRFNAQNAQATQDLMNRGLGNTTVTSAVARGINNDRSAEQRRWKDDVLQRGLNTILPLSQAAIRFKENFQYS